MTDHPRVSGEHDIAYAAATYPDGSSPRERGAPDPDGHQRQGERIIPA